MPNENDVVPGQVWKGNARQGFKEVRVKMVGDQKKFPKITVAERVGGYVYRLCLIKFLREFTLCPDIPIGSDDPPQRGFRAIPRATGLSTVESSKFAVQVDLGTEWLNIQEADSEPSMKEYLKNTPVDIGKLRLVRRDIVTTVLAEK